MIISQYHIIISHFFQRSAQYHTNIIIIFNMIISYLNMIISRYYHITISHPPWPQVLGSLQLPRRPLGPMGAPWGPRAPHGAPGPPMGPHGGPTTPMGPHYGAPWGSLSQYHITVCDMVICDILVIISRANMIYHDIIISHYHITFRPARPPM